MPRSPCENGRSSSSRAGEEEFVLYVQGVSNEFQNILPRGPFSISNEKPRSQHTVAGKNWKTLFVKLLRTSGKPWFTMTDMVVPQALDK